MSRHDSGRLRRAITAVVAIAALLALGACGVPGGGAPVIDKGLVDPQQPGTGSGTVPLPNPAQYTRPEDLVGGYLSAVAGQINVNSQIAAARAYMSPQLADPKKGTWKPGTRIEIVHLLTEKLSSVNQSTVPVSVEIIGSFDPLTGSVTPAQSGASTKLTFSVAPRPGGGFQLVSAPPGMIMTDTALHNETYYTPHSVYFWNLDHTELIPDLRYLPAAMSASLQATTIVKWVLGGSTGIGQAASQPLMAGAHLVDPTAIQSSGSKFIVNLSSEALSLTQEDRTKLLAQIRWSFGLIYPSSDDLTTSRQNSLPPAVELEIEGQPQATDNDMSFIAKNPAANRDEPPRSFAIGGGKVHPLTADQLPLLNAPQNNHVIEAAVATVDETVRYAALVRQLPGEGPSLWIRTPSQANSFVRVNLNATTMLRPVWINKTHTLAVVADGKLVIVSGPKAVATVSVPGTGSITSFSIAPDGLRIAFGAGGNLWLGVLVHGNGLSVAGAHQVNLRASLKSVTAVAWSGVQLLVVGGTAANGDVSSAAVIETWTDGTQASDPLTRYNSVTGIAAYPPDPLAGDITGGKVVMVQTPPFAFIGRAAPMHLAWTSPPWTTQPPVEPFFQD